MSHVVGRESRRCAETLGEFGLEPSVQFTFRSEWTEGTTGTDDGTVGQVFAKTVECSLASSEDYLVVRQQTTSGCLEYECVCVTTPERCVNNVCGVHLQGRNFGTVLAREQFGELFRSDFNIPAAKDL